MRCSSIFALLLLPFLLPAQAHLAVDAPAGSTHYAVPLGARGVAVASCRPGTGLKPYDAWTVALYDTAFRQVAARTASVPGWLPFRGVDADGPRLYFLFQSPENGDCRFLAFDAEGLSLAMLSREAMPQFEALAVQVLGGRAFVRGQVQEMPALLHFDLRGPDGAAKVLPLASGQLAPTSISMEKDTAHGLVHVGALQWRRGEGHFALASYDPDGQRVALLPLPPAEGHSLLSARLSIQDNGDALLLGTYTQSGNMQADGFYMAKYSGPKRQFIRYAPFASFESFLAHWPARQRQRVAQRTPRRPTPPFRMSDPEVLRRGGQYIMISEAYMPTYRYEHFSGGTRVPGRAQPSLSLDGYQYSHAVAAAFSGQGDLLWERAVELGPAHSERQARQAQGAWLASGELLLAYRREGRVVASRVWEGRLLAEAPAVLASVQAGGLVLWDARTLLAWGLEGGQFRLYRIPVVGD